MLPMLPMLDLKLQVLANPEAQEEDWIKADELSILFVLYYEKSVESLSKLQFILSSKKIDPPKIKFTSY